MAAQAGARYAAALSSGTAALHLALKLCGVAPGDEVVCSSLTFSASANAITYEGARPVFVDASPGNWNIDPGLLAEELAACAARGRLPKAVIAVDLYGQSADWRSHRRRVPRARRGPDRGCGRGARRDLPRPPGRQLRAPGRVLVQRQQDHHDLGRRDAGLGRRGPDRQGAFPRHPGARPRAALPALRDRLQLPAVERARRDRPRPARGARGPGRGPPAPTSSTTGASSAACPGWSSCPRRATAGRPAG